MFYRALLLLHALRRSERALVRARNHQQVDVTKYKLQKQVLTNRLNERGMVTFLRYREKNTNRFQFESTSRSPRFPTSLFLPMALTHQIRC